MQPFFIPGFTYGYMKINFSYLLGASALLVWGCTAPPKTAPTKVSTAAGVGDSGAQYDDERIAKIRRSLTSEAELLDWFGPPESRELKPDGRRRLSWIFHARAGEPVSGELAVSLAPDGKVEAYAAHGETLRSPKGSSTSGAGADVGTAYDDQRIASIKRGETTQAQLVQWFGPPESRDVRPDGREQLSWGFGRAGQGSGSHAGVLHVSLGPEGNVDAYSARSGR